MGEIRTTEANWPIGFQAQHAPAFDFIAALITLRVFDDLEDNDVFALDGPVIRWHLDSSFGRQSNESANELQTRSQPASWHP
jgi:hypothetical protein